MRTPPHHSQIPVTLDHIHALLQDMRARQIRMETRLCRLLNAHDLNEFGHPMNSKTVVIIGQTDSVSERPGGTHAG